MMRTLLLQLWYAELAPLLGSVVGVLIMFESVALHEQCSM